MRTDKNWRLLGQGLAVLTLTAALAACGGASDASSTSSGAAASGTSVAGVSPSVSGTPPTMVAADNRYSFQPTVANPTGTPLSFSIQNMPVWATFGVSTGALSGTPSAPDAGTYPNIVIAASDGTTTSALPAFSIQVTAAATSPAGGSSRSSGGSGSSSGSASGSTSSSGSSSGPTASASGIMIPSATQIVDRALNVWTLAGGVVYENGATAGHSANVALLLYYGGTVYQENKSCVWWSWNGSGWVASSNPAPSIAPACSATAASATPTPPTTPTTTTSTTTPTGAFGIQVKGNKFVSAKDGSTVQIVGTNISGLETGRNWRWASFSNAGSAFWSKVLNWGGSGLNTVRLPLNEASWLNYTCYDSGTGASGGLYSAAGGGGYTPDPNNAYQATVKKAVADATAAGLYVILDLHWGSPNNAAGQPLCPIGQPGFADADHSLTFWKQVADTFKANPAVMFELFNEPFGNNDYSDSVTGNNQPGPDAITLRDGGAFYPFVQQNNSNNNVIHTLSLTWQVAGMQDMINTIRGEGATNVILSSPEWWAGEIEDLAGRQAHRSDRSARRRLARLWLQKGPELSTGRPGRRLPHRDHRDLWLRQCHRRRQERQRLHLGGAERDRLHLVGLERLGRSGPHR